MFIESNHDEQLLKANVKYTQIINGVRKQMHLCEHCSKKLGIDNISFNMPINMFELIEDMFSTFGSAKATSFTESDLIKPVVLNDSSIPSLNEAYGHVPIIWVIDVTPENAWIYIPASYAIIFSPIFAASGIMALSKSKDW